MKKAVVRAVDPAVFRAAHDELEQAGLKRRAQFQSVQQAVRLLLAIAGKVEEDYEALPASTKRAVEAAMGTQGTKATRAALRNFARWLGRSPQFPRVRGDAQPLCKKMAEHLPPPPQQFVAHSGDLFGLAN